MDSIWNRHGSRYGISVEANMEPIWNQYGSQCRINMEVNMEVNMESIWNQYESIAITYHYHHEMNRVSIIKIETYEGRTQKQTHQTQDSRKDSSDSSLLESTFFLQTQKVDSRRRLKSLPLESSK